MPKDFYVFLVLLGTVIGLRFLNVSSGVLLFFFAIIVVAQVAFLIHGVTRSRRR